jgi:hypothetical protein
MSDPDAYPFGKPQPWCAVDYLEFDRYIRQYPRPLVIDPPLGKAARMRTWSDPTLGPWPHNAVAKYFSYYKNSSYFVLDGIAHSSGSESSSPGADGNGSMQRSP